jgi:hypothetical protein
MDRLGDQVRRELGRFGPAGDDIAGITRVWAAVVGETVARNAWPARLAKDGTLHVNAASSTWAFELGKLATTILDQLRPELGEATPTALRVAPGPLPDAPGAALAEAAEPTPEIGSEHRAEGAAIAAGIEDEELRELVARAAAASLAGASRRARDDHSF